MRRFPAGVTLAVMVVVVSVLQSRPAWAQASPTPQAFLPVVVQSGAWSAVPGTFVSSLSVQAARTPPSGGSPFVVRFLRADGSVAHESVEYQLSPSGQLFYVPQFQGLPPGRYAAVVLARDPVIAQANLAAEGPPMAATYQSIPAGNLGTGARLGNVFKNYVGYTSVLSVQNTAGVPTQVTVTYRDQAGNTVGPQEQQTIAANGFADFAQSLSALPDGFIGSAHVATSGQKVAVAAHVYNPAGDLVGVSGGTIFHQWVDLPVVYKNYSADGWISSILVQGPLDSPAPIRITFRGAGLAAPVELTDVIPAGAARQYWQGNTPAELPDGFVGPATVESTAGKAIAAFVNTHTRGATPPATSARSARARTRSSMLTCTTTTRPCAGLPASSFGTPT